MQADAKSIAKKCPKHQLVNSHKPLAVSTTSVAVGSSVQPGFRCNAAVEPGAKRTSITLQQKKLELTMISSNNSRPLESQNEDFKVKMLHQGVPPKNFLEHIPNAFINVCV